jgi:predicted ester cyclase
MTSSSGSAQANAALVRASFDAFNAGDTDRLLAVVAPDLVMKRAFPDLEARVEDVVAAEDRVAVRVSFRGTHAGEFREVDPPERLVQTFQNHLQTLEFEDLGERTKLTQTMRFASAEDRDTTMQYGVEEGAKNGFARIDEVLQRLPQDA